MTAGNTGNTGMYHYGVALAYALPVQLLYLVGMQLVLASNCMQ